jgi:hypothetical protein
MDAKGRVGYDAEDFADLACTDRLPYLNAQGKVSCPNRIQQEQLLLPGRFVQNHCLTCVDGQRLFTYDVFAGLESQHCMLEVI